MPHDTHADDAGPRSDGHVVDAVGKACPMPVIELAAAVDVVPIGDRVTLLATDPAARVDVPVWCRMQRQRLLEASDDDGTWRFVVQRLR